MLLSIRLRPAASSLPCAPLGRLLSAVTSPAAGTSEARAGGGVLSARGFSSSPSSSRRSTAERAPLMEAAPSPLIVYRPCDFPTIAPSPLFAVFSHPATPSPSSPTGCTPTLGSDLAQLACLRGLSAVCCLLSLKILFTASRNEC